jgi:hypothetical protein
MKLDDIPLCTDQRLDVGKSRMIEAGCKNNRGDDSTKAEKL